MRILAAALLMFLLATPWHAAGAAAATKATKVTISHGLTLGDAPKYGPDFKYFDYVNPDAPKGGAVRLYSIGGFDSLNPYIIKGNPAAGLGLVTESLMTSSEDDMLSDYGQIAKSVEVPADLSYVIYNLHPGAKFHDGSPITADDVIFSFMTLRQKGQPHYRFYYANVTRVMKIGDHRVRFNFTGPPNRELPQIVGQLPVFSKAYWEKRDFSKTTLEPPLGSGPYRVARFEPGRYIIYQRVRDHWGRNLAVNRGLYNFDTIRYDFYRDQVVALEAFKAHQYDFRTENSSKSWATEYNFPARRKGLVKVEPLPHTRPTGMQSFAFNLRRAKFQDPTVRQALAYAFDFDWSNKNLFYGQYKRTISYFSNSDLAATGKPSPAERKILEPLRSRVPREVFGTAYAPPGTDGSGNIRRNLRKAQRLLRKAGWKVVNNRLVDGKTGQPFEIEFLLVSPAFERVVSPFVRNLRRLGIQGSIRTVDPAQYQNRRRQFDFDVIIASFRQSLSPGNEQRDFWSSAAADRPGSQNVMGIKNKAVDELIETLVAAPNRKQLVTVSRALDRVLTWNHYLIPQWHTQSDRVAWWDRFGRPAIKPKYGVGFFSWWVDNAKDRALTSKPAGGGK